MDLRMVADEGEYLAQARAKPNPITRSPDHPNPNPNPKPKPKPKPKPNPNPSSSSKPNPRCGALSLRLSSGRVIECKGENASVFGAPFTHHAAPSPGGYHEPTFEDGRCTGLRPLARPPQPLTRTRSRTLTRTPTPTLTVTIPEP